MAAEMEGRHTGYSPYTTIHIPKTERHHRSSSGNYFPHSPIRVPGEFREDGGSWKTGGGDYVSYSPIKVPRDFGEYKGHRQSAGADYLPLSPI